LDRSGDKAGPVVRANIEQAIAEQLKLSVSTIDSVSNEYLPAFSAIDTASGGEHIIRANR
jgi:hypothetical protein